MEAEGRGYWTLFNLAGSGKLSCIINGTFRLVLSILEFTIQWVSVTSVTFRKVRGRYWRLIGQDKLASDWPKIHILKE